MTSTSSAGSNSSAGSTSSTSSTGSIRVEVWCAPQPASGRLDRVVEALRVAVGLTLQRSPVVLALYGPATSICAPVKDGNDEHTAAIHKHLSGLRAAGCPLQVEAAAVAAAGLDAGALLHAPVLLSGPALHAGRAAAGHVLAFGHNQGRLLFAQAEELLGSDAGPGQVARAVFDALQREAPRAGEVAAREVADPVEAEDHERQPIMDSDSAGQNTELDLLHEVCPYTFVRTKLALEELSQGDELRILLGNSDSARNVPRSCQSEGHVVLRVEQVSPERWDVVVRRGASRTVGFEEGWVP